MALNRHKWVGNKLMKTLHLKSITIPLYFYSQIIIIYYFKYLKIFDSLKSENKSF